MKHALTAYHRVPFLPPKAGIHPKKPKKLAPGESLSSLKISIEGEGGRLKVESTNIPALRLLSFKVKGKSPSARQWIYKPFWINSKSATGEHPHYQLPKFSNLINGYFGRHKCERFAKLQVLQLDYHWLNTGSTCIHKNANRISNNLTFERVNYFKTARY